MTPAPAVGRLRDMPPKPRAQAMTGDELRDLLKRKGVSQRELARRMEIHFTTVFRWVKGDSNIDKANALLIREVLKAPGK